MTQKRVKQTFKHLPCLKLNDLSINQVITANDDRYYQPDPKHIVAIINDYDDQAGYRAMILYEDMQLIKVKLTPNQLIKRMGERFGINLYRHITPQILDIKRQVPFIHGDHWLIPVTPEQRHNHSWLHLRTDSEIRYTADDQIEMIVNDTFRVECPISRRAYKRRFKSCTEIASCDFAYYQQVTPTLHDKYLLFPDKSPAELREALELQRTKADLKQYGKEQYTNQVMKELKDQNYRQLPETQD